MDTNERSGTCLYRLSSLGSNIAWSCLFIGRVTDPILTRIVIEKQDVLFNTKTCYVVPPGTVERITKETTAIVEHPRHGDLYVADMELSSFQRQVAGQ